MTKTRKIGLVFCGLAAVYSVGWYYFSEFVQGQVECNIQKLQKQQYVELLKYDSLRVSGYPFRIYVDINAPKFKINNQLILDELFGKLNKDLKIITKKNQFVHVDDKIRISTNLLCNRYKIDVYGKETFVEEGDENKIGFYFVNPKNVITSSYIVKFDGSPLINKLIGEKTLTKTCFNSFEMHSDLIDEHDAKDGQLIRSKGASKHMISIDSTNKGIKKCSYEFDQRKVATQPRAIQQLATSDRIAEYETLRAVIEDFLLQEVPTDFSGKIVCETTYNEQDVAKDIELRIHNVKISNEFSKSHYDGVSKFKSEESVNKFSLKVKAEQDFTSAHLPPIS